MNLEKNSPRSRRRVPKRNGNHRGYKRNTISQPYCTKIYVNGIVVGKVVGNVFEKRLVKADHFFHIHLSYCFEIESLAQAQKAGARWVKIFEKDTGRTLWALISTIYEKKFMPPESNGTQLGLHIDFWTIGDKPLGTQMSFWEV